MKVVLFCGGLGSRIREYSESIPKPMVPVGHQPIMCHVMQYYSQYGHDDFILCLGYKGEMIKQYFSDFHYYNSDLIISLKDGGRKAISRGLPDWRVHCVDTGLETMTGGRLSRLRGALGQETFMCTYGDGLSDVPIEKLVAFHKSHGKLATVTAVHPPARFGLIELAGDTVSKFSEKPQTGRDWINGGFFVFEPGLLDYVEGPESSLERDVLERVAADGQLMAFRHDGFFQPMDTLRERQQLEDLWRSGDAPWAAKQ